LLSDTPSQPRAKLQLRDHSSAMFVARSFLTSQKFERMSKYMPDFQFMDVTIVEKCLNYNITFEDIFKICTPTEDFDAKFAGKNSMQMHI
jgi:hypothetical protein